MGNRETHDLAVLAGHVDRAPVGEPGHRELGQLPERSVVVERGGEQLARLGEERHPPAQRLLLGIEARAGERLRSLPGKRHLHLAALEPELDLGAERERHRTEDASLDGERENHERGAVLALLRELGEELVALGDGRDEQRLAGSHDVRHRQPGGDGEVLPVLHDRALVALLGEQLDPLAVLAEHSDRPGPRFGGADSLGQDRVEHLARRDRLGEQLGDPLEPERSVLALVDAHCSCSVAMPRRS